ncbi:MAG: PKD-like domain-containing protein [Bacteroidota bacterium]
MEINNYDFNSFNNVNKTSSAFKMIVIILIASFGISYNSFAQAPPSPTATAANNFTCTSFNANWTAVSGAVAYYIDVSTDVAFTTFVNVYNNLNVGNSLTYNVTGLNSTYYYYRVRVDDGSNVSLNSNTITVNAGPIAATSAATATNITCSSFEANWGALSGATTYYLDVSTSSSFSTFLAGYNNLNIGNVITETITGLTAYMSYYYRVRVSNGCSISSNSNTIVAGTTYPTLSSTLSPSAICSGSAFNYTPSSSTSGTAFAWTRAAVAGISNAAATGIGNPIEVLINTTTSPINVTYVFTLTANGCTNPTTYNVVVTVKDTPSINSNPNPSAICSGSTFNYSITSSTGGASFAWTVAQTGVSGATAGTGTTISEALSTTSINQGTAVYSITVSANGCTGMNNVTATVNPLPVLSSTLTPPAIFTDYVFSYTPTCLITGTAFTWTRATTAGISNTAANGNGDPNEILINTSGNPVNVTYVYYLTVNGCTNPTTYSVIVTVNPKAVWPGDTDNDSLVNNNDLLPIGIHFAQTGTPRANTGNIWQAYVANNWGTQQTNGEDVKHADSNGDGVVDANDTLAITSNFNLTHVIVPPVYTDFDVRATSDMYFVINNIAYNPGDWVTAELWLGTLASPLSNLYGIAFDINYDASVVQTGTESIGYAANWLGTPGTDAITISQIDGLANTAYGAMTRTDHTNRSGYGKIAEFKFQINSSFTATDTMLLSISSYRANDAVGMAKTLTIATDSIFINSMTTGIYSKQAASSVSISPNPFSSQTTVSFTTEMKNVNVKIVDILGKEIKNISFSGKQLVVEKGELNAGVYFIQVISEKNMIANEKMVIQ